MGKKSSRQPKRTPTADNGDPVTTTVIVPTKNIMEITTATVIAPTTLAEPTTRAAFAKFVETSNVDAVKEIIAAAAYRSEEGEIFETLWDRAFDEGYTRGGQVWEKRVETRYDEGYKAGLEEGKDNNYKLFRRLLEKGKDEKHAEWVAAGHGRHCFAVVAILETTGTQTDEFVQPQPQKSSNLEIGIQTGPTTTTHDAGAQYKPPPSISDATSQTEPHLVAATSPAPTVVDYRRNTTSSTNTTIITSIDTLSKPTPPIFEARSQTEPQIVAAEI